jgi:glycosyltransferase involved in cell wall biosynthesis
LEARGEIVAFVDDDILVQPEWARNLLKHFECFGEDIQAVTGRVLPSPRGDPAGFEWDALYGLKRTSPAMFHESSHIPFFPVTAGTCGTGCNMAFRTEFLLRSGLFDPHFGLGSALPGGEETDRFYFILRQGHTILFAPDVCVEHVYAEDRAALHKKIRGYATAQIGLFMKWFWWDPPIRPLLIRYVASRIIALLRRLAPEKEAARKSAPPRAIILGSLLGPFAYLWSLLQESLWPRKTVLVASGKHQSAKTGKPRLLIVLYNSGLSGPESLCRTLVTSLKDRVQINVIVPSAGATTAVLHAAGIGVGFVPRERLRASLNPLRHVIYLLRFAGTIAAYRRTIRMFCPHVIHVDSVFNLPALIAARLSGVPTLLHLQTVPYGVVRRILALLASGLADRVVAVSQASAKPLRGLLHPDPDKLTVVYNGTRLPHPVPASDPTGWVLFIGRLSEDKDPIVFVRAAQKVLALVPNAKFMICGITVPGRERFERKLQEQIARVHIPRDQVLLVRDRDHVHDLLTQSSMVVNCSAVPESFGLAVLEAMAMGRPVVVPDSGAFSEIVTHGETGLLYSAGNFDEMVACIVRLLQNPTEAQTIGLAAHSLVRDRFRDDQMASAMYEQYVSLLNQARPQPHATTCCAHSETGIRPSEEPGQR